MNPCLSLRLEGEWAVWDSDSDNRPWTSLLDIYHPDPWPVVATTVFSTPDDGSRKRPKHVD